MPSGVSLTSDANRLQFANASSVSWPCHVTLTERSQVSVPHSRRHFLVTLATQRSGTKFLGTSFSAGSLVKSLGEVFQPGQGGQDFGGFFAGFIAERRGFAFGADDMRASLDAFICHLQERVAPAALHFDIM